jgi:hypothetical protein
VLTLAHEFGGWEPLGTEPPESWEWREWSGSYQSNDYQRVTEEDARNLADALERALPDVPRHRAWEGPAGGCTWLPDGTRVALPEANPLEYFSGPEGRQCMEEFIRYCRAGEFMIA